MTGVPRNADLARIVSGSDALHLRCALRFEELGNKCRELIAAFRRRDYARHGFGFVDHLRAVNDPEIINDLNQEVLDDLSTRRFDRVHLAPPEIISWTDIDGFSFARGADPQADLLLESFLDEIRRPDALSIERLKHQRVFVHSHGSPEPVARWHVYLALVAEIDRNQQRFVLSGGEGTKSRGALPIGSVEVYRACKTPTSVSQRHGPTKRSRTTTVAQRQGAASFW